MANAVQAVLRATRTSAEWEETLGIVQRVSAVDPGWHGEIRLRFTDFQVYEIGPDRKVVHLEDTAMPRQKRDSQTTEDAQISKEAQLSKEKKMEQTSSEPKPKTELPPIAGDTAPLAALAGDEFTQSLVDLYAANDSAAKSNKPKTAVIADKPARSQIHALVRTLFHSRIDTITNVDGAIVATLKSAQRSNPQSQRRHDRKPRGNNPDGPREEYLHFTLFKENRDTLDAVSHLARALRIKPSNVGTAGTKDRRAATAQRCSLRYGRADALARTNGRVFGVLVGDFAYSAKPVHLGAHAGNEFVITVKQCRLLDQNNIKPVEERVAILRDRVQAALDFTNKHGWINYFGHQRFGTHTTGTHEIGTFILKGDFAGAVAAILHHPPNALTAVTLEEIENMPGSSRDAHKRNLACAMFSASPDRADEALALLPHRFSAETSVMRHLARKQSARDNAGAITAITRGLRTMYLHAYQSLVWNHAASRRWELYGEKVVEGDLVLDKGNGATDPTVTGEDDQPVYADAIGEGVDVDDDDDAPTFARVLTAEEAASGNYSIFDIVLPTPGTEVIYPTNEIGAFYKTFMEEHGGVDPSAMRRPQREFTLTGRYRALLGRFLPSREGEEMSPRCEVRAYARDDEQMHPTDADRLREKKGRNNRRDGNKRGRGDEEEGGSGKKARLDGDRMDVDGETVQQGQNPNSAVSAPAAIESTGLKEATEAKEEAAEHKEATTETQDGDDTKEESKTPMDVEVDKAAVVVTFKLAKSAYATVVLRELMGDLRLAD